MPFAHPAESIRACNAGGSSTASHGHAHQDGGDLCGDERPDRRRRCCAPPRPTRARSASCTTATRSGSTATTCAARATARPRSISPPRRSRRRGSRARRFRDEAGGSAGPWLFAIARHVVLASVERGRIERRAMTRLGAARVARPPGRDAEPDETWLDGLDEALGGPARGPARGDRAARRRRPLLRGGRRRARHLPARRARPRPSRAAHAALPAHERNGGDTVNDLTPELAGLGDALERAAAADLARKPRAAHAAGGSSRPRSRSRSRCRAWRSRPTS